WQSSPTNDELRLRPRRSHLMQGFVSSGTWLHGPPSGIAKVATEAVAEAIAAAQMAPLALLVRQHAEESIAPLRRTG
ncbi:hypothetical protein QUS99_22515, partial [Xanthomonas citri pv. citri]